MTAVTLGLPLTNDQVERLITQEYTAGQEMLYGLDEIAAQRDRNYDYFRGVMNDLPSPAGRSRLVSMDVANYIGLMLPNLMRIFTAGRTIAEYVSPKEELRESTILATRYINDVVFKKDNRGELLLTDWAKDGLIQKVGFAMWWWESTREARDEILDGLSDEQLALEMLKMQLSGDGEIIEHTQSEPGAPQITHAIKVRRWVNTSKCCIDNPPPEEIVISRDARSLDDAVLKGHRTGVFVGDLIKQGFAPEVLNKLPAYVDPYPDRMRKYNDQLIVTDPSRMSSADPTLRKVGILRGILKCDYDGTGPKEWYVVAGGSSNKMTLLDIQPYNWQFGISDFCPEPMPHTVWGTCPADRLAMNQKANTVLLRGMSDGLNLHLNPQREVVKDWIIRPDQLLNMAPGAPVMVSQPGAVREIVIPYVGDKALLTMEYFHGQNELTTGVGRNSAGLDPGALQNQSATAANNMQSAALGRVEMIARTWAQGGMRKLFRGVFNCVKAYQDFARVVQIDGEPQTIDPRAWEGLDDLDVNINTGLGTGSRDRDFMALQSIEATQTAIMEKLGPNPIVDFGKLVRTLQLKAEAAGISYPENFFGEPTNEDGSPWQFKPPEPKPSPDTIVNAQALVQAEEVKGKWSNANKQLELASRERVEVYKAQLDAIVKANELGLDTGRLLLDAKKIELEETKIDKMEPRGNA